MPNQAIIRLTNGGMQMKLPMEGLEDTSFSQQTDAIEYEEEDEEPHNIEDDFNLVIAEPLQAIPSEEN